MSRYEQMRARTHAKHAQRHVHTYVTHAYLCDHFACPPLHECTDARVCADARPYTRTRTHANKRTHAGTARVHICTYMARVTYVCTRTHSRARVHTYVMHAHTYGRTKARGCL